MSLSSKRELVKTVRPRHWRATRTEEERILDKLVANTGHSPGYATHLLNPLQRVHKRHKWQGKRRYTLPVKAALVTVWRAANCMCSKRLAPCKEQFLTTLERHGDIRMCAGIRELLLAARLATVDRLLHSERPHYRKRGLGTIKSSTLLKQAIPVRTSADWDDLRPGFVEADSLGRCNDSTDGEYLRSLVLVDVATASCQLATHGSRLTFHALGPALLAAHL